jgi:hypothetical protein
MAAALLARGHIGRKPEENSKKARSKNKDNVKGADREIGVPGEPLIGEGEIYGG